MASSSDEVGKIRVQLVSVDPRYTVTDADMAVPGTLRRTGLAAVVNYLLGNDEDKEESGKKGDDDDDESSMKISSPKSNRIDFDFMINNRFLRTTVSGYVRANNVSAEDLLVIHFLPRMTKPEVSRDEPETLPDWVSSVKCDDATGVLVSACYDGVLRVMRQSDLSVLSSAVAHGSAIKTLSLSSSFEGLLVASGGLDHQVVVHEYVGESESSAPARLSPRLACQGGHSSSVESTAFSGAGPTTSLASGDWDGKLCLWGLDTSALSQASDLSSSSSSTTVAKKRRVVGSSSPSVPSLSIVAPLSVTKLHASSVSGLAWSTVTPSLLYSGSWDHSVKAFDTERLDVVLTLNGSRAVGCLAKSYHSEVLATGHPDCHVKLWDVRVSKGAGGVLTHDDVLKPDHRGWVTCVAWDKERPFNLSTCSADGTVKTWDVRCSLPIYTIKAHVATGKGRAGKEEGKALGVCYGESGKSIFSGGSDCIIRKFTNA